jgi:phospholipid/cholesterol/gamma-HCH transport system permease protein
MGTSVERDVEARDRVRAEGFDPHLAGIVVVSPATVARKGKELVETAGDIARFSANAVRAVPRMLNRHRPELLCQMFILIRSSSLILWLLMVLAGYVGGLEGVYQGKGIGASAAGPLGVVIVVLREGSPVVWGYILAAKVGCGLVAEIGSMRIHNEIDALEVMGVRPMAYIVATRVAAAWIVLPFIYIVGLGLGFEVGRMLVVKGFASISQGGFAQFFWTFQNPLDLFYSLMKTMVISTVIIFVGCYYGYTARGGPVEVGWNTAKSMLVNLVLIHVTVAFADQLFWGVNPNLPIGN